MCLCRVVLSRRLPWPSLFSPLLPPRSTPVGPGGFGPRRLCARRLWTPAVLRRPSTFSLPSHLPGDSHRASAGLLSRHIVEARTTSAVKVSLLVGVPCQRYELPHATCHTSSEFSFEQETHGAHEPREAHMDLAGNWVPESGLAVIALGEGGPRWIHIWRGQGLRRIRLARVALL